ncbi:MAG: NAD(P)H-dependent glycerol-3-phosphate dehydrogenase [Myxococcales bacterium]
MRAAIIGGGSWGTALAALLGWNGHDAVICARDPAVARAIEARHENTNYLPVLPLPANVRATTEAAAALAGAGLVVLATPSHALRAVVAAALPHLPRGVPMVSATKGIENDTLLTMDEVLEEILPAELHPWLTFLSGPSFARETLQRMPTAVVVAARREEVAQRVAKLFMSDTFRVYTSSDVAGVELGGSLKNVCAIAAGIGDGLGFGNNTRAMLITRGLSELVKVAVRKGANPLTLSGLAGMGDLVLTCTGDLSRNRQVGIELGRGRSVAQVLAGMTQVAEGVRTAKSVHDLAARLSLDLPIHEAVYRILYEALPVKVAMDALAARGMKSEFNLHP